MKQLQAKNMISEASRSSRVSGEDSAKRWRRGTRLLAFLVVALVALAACDGGTSKPRKDPNTTTHSILIGIGEESTLTWETWDVTAHFKGEIVQARGNVGAETFDLTKTDSWGPNGGTTTVIAKELKAGDWRITMNTNDYVAMVCDIRVPLVGFFTPIFEKDGKISDSRCWKVRTATE